MKKIKIAGLPFKLRGKTIQIGDFLDFKAVDRFQQEVYLREIKGVKVISLFPSIQTKVCSIQTQQIARLAQQFKKVAFISISTDFIDKINKWCLAKGIENITIWSDEYLDFATKTNLFIPRIKRLARGIIVLSNNNRVISIDIAHDLRKNVNFKALYNLLDVL